MTTLTTPQESCIWFARNTGQGYQHNWISNFYVESDGLSVEHWFQAEKHRGHPFRQNIILNAATPGKAKRLGRRWKLTEEELAAWNERKLYVMLELVRAKIAGSIELRQKLIETEGPIIEENNWHDNYWGDCVCPKCRHKSGDNYLGRIYEMVRHYWKHGITVQL
jgi:ribA/ribD-fused uncharacterized protein